MAVLLIGFTAGLRNYWHWTIQFAASRRTPASAEMLGIYSDKILIPLAKSVGFRRAEPLVVSPSGSTRTGASLGAADGRAVCLAGNLSLA